MKPKPAPAGIVIAVCTSTRKGVPKEDQGRAVLVEGMGLSHDSHAGPGDRQVSLLAEESIQKMRDLGLEVTSGSFGENLTTRGIPLPSLAPGTRLQVGGKCVLEITMIGKVCHRRCAIYYKAGDCIMPREGIFARVIRGGPVAVGDPIGVL